MCLRDIEATLPPGFRFHPSDEELICHYLYKKISNESVLKGTLVEVDLHTCDPWQLPDVAKVGANEWYFFSFRDRKYATGSRANRATLSGYWKATGKDRLVFGPRNHEIVGMRKTLVFYRNRAPNGIKTEWIMHEFRLEDSRMPSKEDWVLCRVFNKSRGGSLEEELKSTGGISSPSLIYRSKGEIMEEELNSTAGISSPSFISSPPIDQIALGEYQQFMSFFQSHTHQDYSTNSLPSMGLLYSNFLQLPQELNTTPITEFNRASEYEAGFLLDENSLEDDLQI